MHTSPRSVLAILSACFVLLTAACPSAKHLLEKRWFGVGISHVTEPLTNIAWPADPSTPWQQSLRYCWVSASDYTNLNPTLQMAIAIWQPAMGPSSAPYSSLLIRPDGSGQQADILCKDASADALQIADMDPSSSDVQGETTMGYWWQPVNQQTRGRHVLTFERLQNRDTPQNPGAYDIATLAHELGHALGLEHEHGRPDRDQYISFYCQNLRDYNDVKARLKDGDTMDKACTDLATASKYGFSAFAFIKVNTRAPYLGQLAWSTTFDFSSIMIYGSYEGASVNNGDKRKAVMLKKPVGLTKSNPGLEEEFWQGGVPISQVDKVAISDGDKARIAQLYPNVKPADDDPGVARATNPSWSGTSHGLQGRAIETGKVGSH